MLISRATLLTSSASYQRVSSSRRRWLIAAQILFLVLRTPKILAEDKAIENQVPETPYSERLVDLISTTEFWSSFGSNAQPEETIK